MRTISFTYLFTHIYIYIYIFDLEINGLCIVLESIGMSNGIEFSGLIIYFSQV